jgi:hypothetical protein
VKPEDSVIDGRSREQVSALAADSSKRGEDPEASETPVSAPSNVEDFKDWVRASLLPTLQQDVIARIACYEAGDLPEMIEVVSGVELAGYAGVDEARPSIALDQQQQRIDSEETKHLSKVEYWEAARCGNVSMWLRHLRIDLEEELEGYEKDQGELIFPASRSVAPRSIHHYRTPRSPNTVIRGDYVNSRKRMDPGTRNEIECLVAVALYMIVLVVLWYFFGYWWVEHV